MLCNPASHTRLCMCASYCKTACPDSFVKFRHLHDAVAVLHVRLLHVFVLHKTTLQFIEIFIANFRKEFSRTKGWHLLAPKSNLHVMMGGFIYIEVTNYSVNFGTRYVKKKIIPRNVLWDFSVKLQINLPVLHIYIYLFYCEIYYT